MYICGKITITLIPPYCPRIVRSTSRALKLHWLEDFVYHNLVVVRYLPDAITLKCVLPRFTRCTLYNTIKILYIIYVYIIFRAEIMIKTDKSHPCFYVDVMNKTKSFKSDTSTVNLQQNYWKILFVKAMKIRKNMIFLCKIVIFHTKYPKNVRASLRSAQFF